MSALSTILAAALGVVFIAVGLAKLVGQASVVASFERWGYARAVLVATGSVELLAGVLLLVGIVVTPLAITGVLLVVFVMMGALLTHQHAHDPIGRRLLKRECAIRTPRYPVARQRERHLCAVFRHPAAVGREPQDPQHHPHPRPRPLSRAHVSRHNRAPKPRARRPP